MTICATSALVDSNCASTAAPNNRLFARACAFSEPGPVICVAAAGLDAGPPDCLVCASAAAKHAQGAPNARAPETTSPFEMKVRRVDRLMEIMVLLSPLNHCGISNHYHTRETAPMLHPSCRTHPA